MQQIKKATTDDIPSILPLVEEYWFFEDIPAFDQTATSRLLEQLITEHHLGTCWIAKNLGNTVGYLIAVYVFSLEHHGIIAEIDEFFIQESHRGKGMGTKLLKATLLDCRQYCCTNVSLRIDKKNDEALRFYEKAGFKHHSKFDILEKEL